jgi:hypothetical protein
MLRQHIFGFLGEHSKGYVGHVHFIVWTANRSIALSSSLNLNGSVSRRVIIFSLLILQCHGYYLTCLRARAGGWLSMATGSEIVVSEIRASMECYSWRDLANGMLEEK